MKLLISDVPDEAPTFFHKMVDDLVEFSAFDDELADGIKWLDGQAKKEGISFYDIVFRVLYNHDVNARAKKWLETRKDGAEKGSTDNTP